MKRLLSLALALCLLGSLCACGSQTPAETTTPADHPSKDGTLNILMVGNSFCYYYVEELYGLLAANPDPNRGYQDVNIYNLYYSGCSLDQHLSWYETDNAPYQLWRTDANGRNEMGLTGQWSLKNALKAADWDYISLQDSTRAYQTGNTSLLSNTTAQTAAPLLELFHTEYPYAQLLWHRTWTYEVGRVSDAVVYTEELLKTHDEAVQAVSDYMCNEFDKDKDYDLTMVNSGTAWAEARAQVAAKDPSLLPLGGLCARKGKNNTETFPAGLGYPDAGDGYHDGDIGGGQFLNACVWYETLTGQSCLDNPYKPSGSYQLSDALVEILRNAAHKAAAVK